MSENDAEWFNPETPVVRRPRPRPAPTTTTPRRNFTPQPTWMPRYPPPGVYPNRPRKPTIRPPRRRHHDEADKVAPRTLSAGAIASISVVSSLLTVAAIIVLLYFTILRKKFTKKKKIASKSDFSIRVEDVAHIDIDDSSNIYENTKDLQRLVKSIRHKPKTPVSHVNTAFQPPPSTYQTKSNRDKQSAPPHDNNVGITDDYNISNSAIKLSSPTRSAPPPPNIKPVSKPPKMETLDASISHYSSTELLMSKTKGGVSDKQKRGPPVLPKTKNTKRDECSPNQNQSCSQIRNDDLSVNSRKACTPETSETIIMEQSELSPNHKTVLPPMLPMKIKLFAKEKSSSGGQESTTSSPTKNVFLKPIILPGHLKKHKTHSLHVLKPNALQSLNKRDIPCQQETPETINTGRGTNAKVKLPIDQKPHWPPTLRIKNQEEYSSSLRESNNHSPQPKIHKKPIGLPDHVLKSNKTPVPSPMKLDLLLPIPITSDTPETMVMDNPEATPELLSLKQKKALWESAASKQ